MPSAITRTVSVKSYRVRAGNVVQHARNQPRANEHGEGDEGRDFSPVNSRRNGAIAAEGDRQHDQRDDREEIFDDEPPDRCGLRAYESVVIGEDANQHDRAATESAMPNTMALDSGQPKLCASAPRIVATALCATAPGIATFRTASSS